MLFQYLHSWASNFITKTKVPPTTALNVIVLFDKCIIDELGNIFIIIIIFQALKKNPGEMNSRAADMWSYAVMLWEMSMREVPFGDLSPMEAGMRIATEGLRLDISPGVSPHMAKLIRICMNEDPGKRPTFDQIIPILEKMKK